MFILLGYMLLRHKIKQLIKPIRAINNAIFKDRKILIISDHNIISIPLNRRFQRISLLLIISVVAWSVYSSGRFVAYQGMIAQKEIEVMRSNIENQELQQLYDSMHTEMQTINGFMDELKKATQPNSPKNGGAAVKPSSANQSSNINPDALRNQMVKLRHKMEKKLWDSSAKLETTIAATGLELEPLLKNKKLTALREFAMQPVAEGGGVGGPYIPASAGGKNTPEQDPLRSRLDYLISLSKLANEIPIGSPITTRKITSGFGMREDPFTGRNAMHAGIDFVGPYGGKVYATAEGKVTYAGWYSEYGNLVEIKHSNGITTRFAHLKDILVREGQKVNRTSVIGTQGNTGRSTGTHVHYEVRINNEPRNPKPFVTAGE